MSDFFDVLPETYEKWIRIKELESKELPELFNEVSKKNLDLCFESASRIRRGIKILSEDKLVFRAFILAHRAMLYQFSVSDRIKSGNKTVGNFLHLKTWGNGFLQIAFILQCLESLLVPESNYRSVTDLLWFPTGGGKTEAYLGMTAMLLF